jgi:Tol biopolymer transport system component
MVRDEWVGDPSCPRSGAGLVYQTWRCQSDVWELRIADDGTVMELAEPLIQSMRWDGDARISPDGTRVVFASARSGHAELWICRRDGREPVRLTSLGGASLGSPCWSPDSRQVVYHTSPEGYAAVHVMDAAGGRPNRLSHDPCNELPCAWSADGRWIFIASDRGDAWQIWKLRSDGSQRVQLTRDGGLDAQQSDDSRWIYYIKPASQGLWRMAVDGGPEELVHDRLSRANRGNWAVHGARVYHFVRQDGRSELVAFDLDTGALRTIASFDGLAGPGVAASPDGKAVLYARTDDALLDLMLVEGFR